MLIVISPAKRLDDTATLPRGLAATQPDFSTEARELTAVARGLTATDLRRLMQISPALADLNRARFAEFDTAPTRPAALFFAGDTYTGLEAKTLDADALRHAQDHLRILSGLYGLLRPLDQIKAYRLEMGSRLTNPRGGDLYAYWRGTIAPALNVQARAIGAKALINCASVEYFGAVDAAALTLPVITPVFLEDREGGAKTISFWAKKARGAMARFIIENRLTDPDDLHAFSTGGYGWDKAASARGRPVFRRVS